MKLNLIIVILSRCGCDNISWEVIILITYYMLPVKKPIFMIVLEYQMIININSSWYLKERTMLSLRISVLLFLEAPLQLLVVRDRGEVLYWNWVYNREPTPVHAARTSHTICLSAHNKDYILQSSLNRGKNARQSLSKLNCTRIRNYLRFTYEN